MKQLSLFDRCDEDYVLISLKPQFYNLILEGKKKHEFRKRFPEGIRKAFIYVTKPVGAIKALFEFDEPITEPSGLIGHEGIGVQEFINGEKSGRIALPIKRVQLLQKEVDLNVLKEKFNVTAPQSFLYLRNYPRLLQYLLSSIQRF
jgi:predicted transcriptional regulator